MTNTSYSESPFGLQPGTQLSHSLNIHSENVVFHHNKSVLQSERQEQIRKVKQNFCCILLF